MNVKLVKTNRLNHPLCSDPTNYSYHNGTSGNDYAYFHDLEKLFFIKVSHNAGEKAELLSLQEDDGFFNVEINIISDPSNQDLCTIVFISPTNYRNNKDGHLTVSSPSGPVRSGTVLSGDIGNKN